MKLIKFRIKNYKAIIDSGDCYFSDKLTILAGKNESGKTSILEALEDFHQDNTIRDEAKPIQGDGIPEISISFNLSVDEINEIFREIDMEIKFTEEAVITLNKKYSSKDYFLTETSIDAINLSSIYETSKKQALGFIKKIEGIIKTSGETVIFPKLDEQKLIDYKTELNIFKSQNPGLIDVLAEVTNIDKIIDDYSFKEEAVIKFINKFIETQLPYFVLFSSFNDEFPKSIPIASLVNNEWAKDLEQVSNFDISKMSSANQQEQKTHQQSVNVDFTEKFEKFWTQEKIKLEVAKDGLDINFWIVENDIPYYPSQRSKGQQWYLAFYVKIVARLREDKPNIILIDEPGLYLHAKAQKDLLRVLTEYTIENPVIFSTHSPYLITEDNLESVRLIERTSEGTKILGKIHAHPTADKETLTPILTAIGLGINDSITNLDQKDNVVIEGPEDVFYLRAFKELEQKTLKTNFINGGGAPNMGIVGSILEGWGANVYYLYDNDQGKKDGVKNLKSWKPLQECIKTVLKKDKATIVDIFSISDFKSLVLEDSSLSYTSLNSEYVKSLSTKPDKVLLARKFLQKAKEKAKEGEFTLDKETKNNIQALFKEIEFNHAE